MGIALQKVWVQEDLQIRDINYCQVKCSVFGRGLVPKHSIQMRSK